MATKTKKEGASIDEAAEAFVLLHDSGNYSSREYDLLLDQLRACVKKDNVGPIVPEDPDADPDAPDETADLTAEVLQRAEEGTLTPPDDGGRALAAFAKESAAKKDEAAAEDDKS